MNTLYLTEKQLSVDEFATVCEQTTQLRDFPLAYKAELDVLIYQHKELANAAASDRQSVLSELHRALSSGPGVFVVKGLFSDIAAVDRSSMLFEQILLSESENSTGGDHFAAAGHNGRIWNALQKVAERDADAFIDYYCNPLLALICESWVGPGYTLTAQVNQVRPGGKAQQPHRDYHLGFQSNEQVARFPLPLQILSQYLTLQGAVAHSDMPVESGPTQLLPWSHQYQGGYLAWRDETFIEYFRRNAIQLPLEKGDGLFFNPALFHAAGSNHTHDHIRTANLLQVSSAFGKTMEKVNHIKVLQHLYPALRLRRMSEEKISAVIAAAAEGYSFPTNLDSDPPVGGLVPQTQQSLLAQALQESWTPTQFNQRLEAHQQKRQA
ncbi:phytanoyl-CoA dioxygenase [Erwinia persicina]|uniref:phytanoyl-CoA dioxygenase family protein n=1 Tax=Erwinia persicina TaxID=55211 RepID=UPI000E50CCDC|nr:phytanoyl-CoA dioxygenase family protein [Erwinia persicina]AXU97284.1 phytanoyl-CoA dioxygenase [Erwinia persicina]MBC3947868.1 phytanoyl-CoA dioxygenase family protein [Erwinia persicina]MBD8168800.1 phytanoyl-CoA dioxygenase family protein [Erwinia persicina]MCQ4106301.1 phytanoyl-CoA dioxygenase family protein [Erwinia persicina]QZQ50478.1 phytanoyl-CoA dioxygenase family protein [Erwinia persicina]